MGWLDFQTLTNISIITTLIILIFQINHVVTSYKNNIDIKRRNQAIELSKFYAESIMPKLSYITRVFKELDVENDLKNIKFTDMKYFNTSELNKLLNEKTISKFNDVEKIELDKLFANSLYFSKSCLEDKIYYRSLAHTKTKDISEILKDNPLPDKEKLNNISSVFTKLELEIILRNELYSIQSEVLNELEYFSMYFVNDLADEEVVYQSLHQSYLSIIKVLYVFISSINVNSHEKYYTNIISLYRTWAQKKVKLEEDEFKNSENNITYKPGIKK